jgi:hypothetical protein
LKSNPFELDFFASASFYSLAAFSALSLASFFFFIVSLILSPYLSRGVGCLDYSSPKVTPFFLGNDKTLGDLLSGLALDPSGVGLISVCSTSKVSRLVSTF